MFGFLFRDKASDFVNGYIQLIGQNLIIILCCHWLVLLAINKEFEMECIKDTHKFYKILHVKSLHVTMEVTF